MRIVQKALGAVGLGPRVEEMSMGIRGDHWDGISAVETAGDLTRGSGQERQIRQEKESWKLYRAYEAICSRNEAKKWYNRIQNGQASLSDYSIGSVKKHVGCLIRWAEEPKDSQIEAALHAEYDVVE